MFSISKSTCYVLVLTLCTSLALLLFSYDGKDRYLQLVHPSQARLELYRRHDAANNEQQKLFDVSFKYLLNNEAACNDSALRTVILVTSFTGNVETRSAMRRAFSAQDLRAFNMSRIFLVADGSRSQYTVSQKALQDEHKRYGDLVQGNFFEAYRNLTYKHMMGLRWVSQYCRNVRYVVKMDDDIVANMYQVAELLSDLTLPKDSAAIAGYVMNGMTPIREPANKWYVTRAEFPGVTYPPFVSGWFYVTTPQVCAEMTELSKTVPYFWIDDVYVTGLLAKLLNVRHLDIGKHFTVNPEFFDCCIRGIKTRNYDCDVIVGPNGGDNNLFYTFNKAYSVCAKRKCKKRPFGKSLNDTCVAQRKINIGRGSGSVGTYPLI